MITKVIPFFLSQVVTAACAAISNLAIDPENSAIMTDYGVIPLLAKLTKTVSTTFILVNFV